MSCSTSDQGIGRFESSVLFHARAMASRAAPVFASQSAISSSALLRCLYARLPEWVEERLKEELAEKSEVSGAYSWPPSLFNELKRHASKQAKEVTCRAIISPSSNGNFADFVGEVKFSGLALRGQTLHHDHVRDPGTDDPKMPSLVLGGTPVLEGSFDLAADREVAIRQGDGALLIEKRDKDHHVIQLREFGTVSARIEENQNVYSPQHLAYEIKSADADIPVSVFLRSKQGFSLNTRDAVGYVYYRSELTWRAC